MHRMSRFPEKLKIQSCGNSTESCVHYICTECLDWQKNWMSRDGKMQWKIVYVIYLRNFGICNICTIYVGKSGFAEKYSIQNCVNSTGNCLRYICTECLD